MKFQKKHTLVTWGGTACDFRVLEAQCGDSPCHKKMARQLAWGSVDVPLASASTIGTMVGLDAAAFGMGLGAKRLDSVDMPTLWKKHPIAVLEHVAEDARKTAMVYYRMFQNINPKPVLQWITRKSKRPMQWVVEPVIETGSKRPRLPTAKECSEMAAPKTPFVPTPPKDKDSCLKWLN